MDGDPACPICLGDDKDEGKIRLPCQHEIGGACLLLWLNRPNTPRRCPMCRRDAATGAEAPLTTGRSTWEDPREWWRLLDRSSGRYSEMLRLLNSPNHRHHETAVNIRNLSIADALTNTEMTTIIQNTVLSERGSGTRQVNGQNAQAAEWTSTPTPTRSSNAGLDTGAPISHISGGVPWPGFANTFGASHPSRQRRHDGQSSISASTRGHTEQTQAIGNPGSENPGNEAAAETTSTPSSTAVYSIPRLYLRIHIGHEHSMTTFDIKGFKTMDTTEAAMALFLDRIMIEGFDHVARELDTSGVELISAVRASTYSAIQASSFMDNVRSIPQTPIEQVKQELLDKLTICQIHILQNWASCRLELAIRIAALQTLRTEHDFATRFKAGRWLVYNTEDVVLGRVSPDNRASDYVGGSYSLCVSLHAEREGRSTNPVGGLTPIRDRFLRAIRVERESAILGPLTNETQRSYTGARGPLQFDHELNRSARVGRGEVDQVLTHIYRAVEGLHNFHARWDIPSTRADDQEQLQALSTNVQPLVRNITELVQQWGREAGTWASERTRYGE